MRMGLVRKVKITYDASTSSFVIPVVIERTRGPPEIPIPRSSNGSVTDQLEQVMTRVAALPLEQVVEGLDGLIGAARRIVDDPALPQLLQNLARTSEALAAAAQQVEPTLDAVKSVVEHARASLAEVQTLAEDSRTLPEDFIRCSKRLPKPRVRYVRWQRCWSDIPKRSCAGGAAELARSLARQIAPRHRPRS